MWEYIVLGQIPGTQIQISFETWLLATTGAGLLLLTLIASRAGHSHHALTALRISRVLKTAAYGKWLTAQRFIRA